MTPQVETTPPAAGRSRLQRMATRPNTRAVFGVYAVLIVMLFASRFVSSSFGPLSLLSTVIELGVFAAMVGFGQYLVIMIGGLDISVPSVMTFAAVVLTDQTGGSDSKLVLVLPAVILLGIAIGLFNGLGIVYVGISPVVMTLAVNVILGGLVLVYTAGTPAGSSPPALSGLVQGKAGPIPLVGIVLVVFATAATFLMTRTMFGRQVQAIGSNSTVAFLSGVPVKRLTLTVYAISGATGALGGVLLTGYSGQSYLTLGDPYLLLSLAAVILGGVAIQGGEGSYVGVVGGALVLTAIGVILSGTDLPQSVRQIVFAAVIIGAVLASRRRTRT